MGLSFLDAFTGTVVGAGGTILRTTNGGTNWSPQTSGTTRWLWGVSFTDANRGTVVGDSGIILRTTDWGATWTTQNSGTTQNLRGVTFPNANTGFVVGDYATILRTGNGGANWVSQYVWPQDFLWGVIFINWYVGTAVGENGTILRTYTSGFGVEERDQPSNAGMPDRGLTARPDPFASYTSISGHERDHFVLYDVSGRRVGTYRGDRIGEGLRAGVYFLKEHNGNSRPLRIVKVR
jgi:hypothetical protein